MRNGCSKVKKKFVLNFKKINKSRQRVCKRLAKYNFINECVNIKNFFIMMEGVGKHYKIIIVSQQNWFSKYSRKW